MLPAYAELHCLTNFSFLRGASHPEELVERAAALGYAALAITDECSVAGVVRAHVAAKEARPEAASSAPRCSSQDGPKLVLLATDRTGYGKLSELITKGDAAPKKGSYRLTRDDLDGGLRECLALLVPSSSSDRRRSRMARRAFSRPRLDRSGAALRSRRPRAARRPARARTRGGSAARRRRRRAHARALAPPPAGRAHRDPPRRAGARGGHALFPNAERHLRLRMRLAQIYPPALLAETLRIAERCTFSLDELRYEYPEELVPAGETPAS